MAAHFFLAPFVEDYISTLNFLGALSEKKSTMYVWVYFCIPKSVPLIYTSTLTPTPLIILTL